VFRLFVEGSHNGYLALFSHPNSDFWFLLSQISITKAFPQWALIELARRPEIQETLRAELRGSISGCEDLTYDQLVNDLPYLDAFICELLRLHPALPQTIRMVCSFPSLFQFRLF
jgi:cytochrome P450